MSRCIEGIDRSAVEITTVGRLRREAAGAVIGAMVDIAWNDTKKGRDAA